MVKDYKNTDAGIIPKDWNTPLLSEISDFENGKAHEQFIDDKGDYIVVNSKFISQEGRVVKYSNENLSPLTKGDIAIVMSDVPNGKAIAKCFYIDKDNRYTLNQRIGCIKPFAEIDNDYLFYKLNRNKYFLAFDSGSGQTNLKKSEILACRVALPPTKAEQTAISSAINNVGTLIFQLEKLLAKKRNIKIGAMQELLTGEKRIGTFNDEWITIKLGQIGEFKNGINKGEGNFGFGYPFINLMDVFQKPITFNSQNLGLINSTSIERKTYELKEGDVIFVRSSVKPTGVGLTTVINKDLENTVYSGFLIRFRDDGTLNKEYKAHCFFEEGFRKKIIESSTVSANTNINQSVLKRLEIKIPSSHDEQIAIAKILSAMDNEIQELERKSEKYKMLKQGMMQILLTGKIRLV
jgi:type I restriction enzyme S subunit